MSVSSHEILLYSPNGWCWIIDLATLRTKTILGLPVQAHVIDLGDSYILFKGPEEYSIYNLKNMCPVKTGKYLFYDDPALFKQAYLRFLPQCSRFKWHSKVFYIEQESKKITVKCMDDPAFLTQWYAGGDIFINGAVFLPDTGKIAVLLCDGFVTLLELQKDGKPFFNSGSSPDELPDTGTGGNSEMPEEESEISISFRCETPKVGRNDPCPCGSGKKFKFCCGK